MSFEFIKKSLICPYCKEELQFDEEVLKCNTCKNEYIVSNDIPVMINTDEDVKKMNMKLYANYDKYFKEAGTSRYATFMNLGYVSNDNEEYSDIELVQFMINKNSIKLLLEVIGRVDLENKKILDVSCGRGGNISVIMNYFRPSNVVGFDICYENIMFCKEINKSKKVTYCVGDAENMPFVSNSFDIVLNVESAFAYPNRLKFYDEVHRVLSVGGIFLYADVLENEEFEKSERYLEEKGFRFIRSQDITTNIIDSCNQASSGRMKSLSSVDEIDNMQKLKNMIVAPGSNLYDQLISKIQKYKILTLIKER